MVLQASKLPPRHGQHTQTIPNLRRLSLQKVNALSLEAAWPLSELVLQGYLQQREFHQVYCSWHLSLDDRHAAAHGFDVVIFECAIFLFDHCHVYLILKQRTRKLVESGPMSTPPLPCSYIPSSTGSILVSYGRVDTRTGTRY